jgi:hypothetical protein
MRGAQRRAGSHAPRRTGWDTLLDPHESSMHHGTPHPHHRSDRNTHPSRSGSGRVPSTLYHTTHSRVRILAWCGGLDLAPIGAHSRGSQRTLRSWRGLTEKHGIESEN